MKLIILDIKMPKVDGLEVLKRVKSHPVLKFIPVVILTSSSIEEDIKTSYEHHANAYIVKPVSYNEFREAVKLLGKFWVTVNKTQQITL